MTNGTAASSPRQLLVDDEPASIARAARQALDRSGPGRDRRRRRPGWVAVAVNLVNFVLRAVLYSADRLAVLAVLDFATAPVLLTLAAFHLVAARRAVSRPDPRGGLAIRGLASP
jgi:hypothetical protein